MVFNSLTFFIFLPAVFVTYWLICGRSAVSQNLIMIIASFVFYGWLDWRLCGLLAFSITCAYGCGLKIGASKRHGKAWAVAGICANLCLLGFFKYYNFFTDSVAVVCSRIGVEVDIPTLRLVLPIGISFYSFMAISYVVDVYRKVVPSSASVVTFFAAMSFFPQLLAGPIGRMPNMLPQFEKKRVFDYDLAVDGCRQMLWGFFKKIVIADGCAGLTDRLFIQPSAFSGSVLAVGAFMYAVQIYADFSGYSDIAIGCGKLFGIRMMRNFAFPYFATNISDFWRRWHISLTTWFRDYVYIPLGGSRCSLHLQVRNVVVVFLLSGLWHGADWTFVVWGLIHGCLFVPYIFFAKRGPKDGGKIYNVLGWAVTMLCVTVAWVFFRASSLQNAILYLDMMFSVSLFELPRQYLSMLPWVSFFIVAEWLMRYHDHALDISCMPKIVRWPIYLAFCVVCLSYQQRSGEFIYFQF